MSPGARAVQQLKQLAANPLDALRSKRCLLHITATYFPLTEQEIAAVARQHAGHAPLPRTHSAAGSARVANMLRR